MRFLHWLNNRPWEWWLWFCIGCLLLLSFADATLVGRF